MCIVTQLPDGEGQDTAAMHIHVLRLQGPRAWPAAGLAGVLFSSGVQVTPSCGTWSDQCRGSRCCEGPCAPAATSEAFGSDSGQGELRLRAWRLPEAPRERGCW